MEEINKDLRTYIEETILPLYRGFDQAHGPEHVQHVIQNSFELIPAARELYGQVDANMVYAIAAYHDTGLQFDRENHGVASGQYLMADEKLRTWFTAGREPRSVYGRIVSEADRDIVPERIVERCLEYGYKHYSGLTGEEQIQRAVAHMKEKYAAGGYMKRYLPCPQNEEGLQTFRNWLKTGEIYEICKRYAP